VYNRSSRRRRGYKLDGVAGDDVGLKLKVALLGLVAVAREIIEGISERQRFFHLRLAGGI